MSLDIAKFRGWARITHTEDDPAIGIAWAAAVRELEDRTGWVVDPVTRTQYVQDAPNNDEGLVRLERQPATAVTVVDSASVTQTLSLTLINGIHYVGLNKNSGGTAITLTYPVQLTVSCGSNTLNPLLEMALLQRVTQLVQQRGDDTVALSSDYWDRISAMMGKGIG